MLTILLIEDEPEMQKGLRDNLEFEGYKVDVAGSGKEGLKKDAQSYVTTWFCWT